MAKSIIKEALIILLLLIVIIVALGIIFYNYIPANKAVPNVEKYSTSETIKTELNERVTEEEKVLVTYELTSSELKNYERTKDYTKGKANPFSTYDTSTPSTNDEGNVTNTDSKNANVQTSSSGTSTFYGNTGTK